MSEAHINVSNCTKVLSTAHRIVLNCSRDENELYEAYFHAAFNSF